MLVEFSVANYRSIKEKQVFSFEANTSNSKSQNVEEVQLPNKKSLRLVKSAIIYGANASGKSNVLRALDTFLELVLYSKPIRGGHEIRQYEPFSFATETKDAPTDMGIKFIYQGVLYCYEISYNRSEILTETLDYYPKGQAHNLLKRTGGKTESGLIHKVRLGRSVGNKEIDVFKNHLTLQKFSNDIPNELLSSVYLHLIKWFINTQIGSNTFSSYMSKSTDKETLLQMEQIIMFADTKLSGIAWEDDEIRGWEDENIKILRPLGKHIVYNNEGKAEGVTHIPFHLESVGTNRLFDLSQIILWVLESGGVMVYDELDNSLHPKIVKMLVQLFHSPTTNPNAAQLLFATHDITLLDNSLMRTDQIWFTEKNERGETELYSAQDFEGIREDIPFDKWYMAGKFGGTPSIQDINSIFENA